MHNSVSLLRCRVNAAIVLIALISSASADPGVAASQTAPAEKDRPWFCFAGGRQDQIEVTFAIPGTVAKQQSRWRLYHNMVMPESLIEQGSVDSTGMCASVRANRSPMLLFLW